MPYCSKCGTKIKRGVKFCLECGTRIAPTRPPTKSTLPKGKPGLLAPRALVVVVGVAIVAILGWYFLAGSGKGGGNSATLTVSPSPLTAGQECTLTLSVTNGESSTMTISRIELVGYKDGQLYERPLTITSENFGQFGITGTIPAGRFATVIVLDGYHDEAGNYRYEAILTTNFGELIATMDFTVTS